MPSRHSDRHRERVVYDDEDPYYDDGYYDRPRASRRVSRSTHDEPGRSRRHHGRYEDSISPPRPSARARSVDHRPARRRYDSYDDYSPDYDDRRHRSSARGRKDGRASTSRGRLQRQESDKTHILQAAASAAVVAGAAEAWRMRKEKTSWTQKGTKMATAAAGAAAIAAFKDNGSKDSGGKKDAVSATLGGLLVNRLANGGGKR